VTLDCDVLHTQTLRNRVKVRVMWGLAFLLAAFRRRPWAIDIMSGLQLAGISVFFRLDPMSVIDRAAYSFLDKIPVGILEDAMFGVGVLQIAAGLVHRLWGRIVMAALASYLYSAFVVGLYESDAHASTVVTLVVAVLGNLLILFRVY